MIGRQGTLVFSRMESHRLPGKALRVIGGMPLLERVIRRAQTLPWPVYLATTEKSCDDPLVELAARLGTESFRGSEDCVLERAVLAAEKFGLDCFVRLCGDRPVFPLDDLLTAVATMNEKACGIPAGMWYPDMVTNCLTKACLPGLTTEVIRTKSLRQVLDAGVSNAQQEHMTAYFYKHPEKFCIVEVPPPAGPFAFTRYAVDTESDLLMFERIFSVYSSLDVNVNHIERILTL
jgi:spore coat polysaccharide biosynthesis protein SpsF